jgi:protein-arginine kinase activator protein McsA
VAEDESGISSITQQAEEAPAGGEEEEQGGTELERKQKQLEKAVEEEDYERAADLRDEIQRLKQEEQEQEQNKN